MKLLDVESLKEQFNAHGQEVRLLTLLSPTCPECQCGYQAVKVLLEKVDSSQLAVFIIWVSMLEKDNPQTALYLSQDLRDSRIVRYWDQEKHMGMLFEKTLKLTRTAWDVYLLYAPGVVWNENHPPEPTFWMHQLAPDSGANQELCLKPDRLLHEMKQLLKIGKPL